MKKQVKFLLKKAKIFTIFVITLTMLFQISCNKYEITIHGIIDTIENCSLPYIVNFYPDAEYEGSDVEFIWDFGDGESTHERTPVHLYEKTGNYHVTLTIKNEDTQESKSIMLDLSDESIPIISSWDFEVFGNEIFWAPSRFKFLNKSQHATYIFWDFGNGDLTSTNNPEYEFTEPGDYIVSMSAVCNGDTATDSEVFSILPPPDEIYINNVTVSLPNSFLGSNIFCAVWYDGHMEEESGLAHSVSSFPITFDIDEDLFWFDGTYDYSNLEFEIWTSMDNQHPAKIFSVEARDLQSDYYPNLLSFDDGYGFLLDAEIDYKN